ncbi:MAG: FAD-binding oxidoreductase [Casimicrobiaceae bacterium]
MPNPRFTRPWHGVPREEIHWNPDVVEDACIGCGTCVTGCSRMVYRFDFDRKKAVVVDPLNCMVGCTTCANTCPTHAIALPPIETVLALEGRAQVRHAVEDDLVARRADLGLTPGLPHPDRVVELRVDDISRPAPNVLIVRLAPVVAGECFCQFAPGQYVEVWVPDTAYLSRAYSIGNAPREDGSIDLQVRRVEGGRLSEWAFNRMKLGEHVRVRGPLGAFTMRSPVDRALLFVAGGTGFAPVEALIEQQLEFAPQRDMLLVWGMADLGDFYALDLLESWNWQDTRSRIVLAAEHGIGAVSTPAGIAVVEGRVADALRGIGSAVADRDAYVAGPPAMIRSVLDVLHGAGLRADEIHVDSFGAG